MRSRVPIFEPDAALDRVRAEPFALTCPELTVLRTTFTSTTSVTLLIQIA
jgi:hypothetical protein